MIRSVVTEIFNFQYFEVIFDRRSSSLQLSFNLVLSPRLMFKIWFGLIIMPLCGPSCKFRLSMFWRWAECGNNVLYNSWNCMWYEGLQLLDIVENMLGFQGFVFPYQKVFEFLELLCPCVIIWSVSITPAHHQAIRLLISRPELWIDFSGPKSLRETAHVCSFATTPESWP